MNIITIDCGASFVKGAAFKDNIKVKNISRKAPGYSINPFSENYHISELYKIVENMILSLSVEGEDNYLCISNEMHGFVLTDEKAEPITDYISWQLDLGQSILREPSVDHSLYINSGMPLRGGLPSCNLAYINESGKIEKCIDVYFYTLGDFLIRKFSGKEPFASKSNAASTGLFDIQKNEWNKELIHFIGCHNIIFPTVLERSIEFKMNNLKYVVLPAIGDQQAALLGAGLTDNRTLSFNLGTGAQVSRISKTFDLGKAYQVRPYFYNMYLITIPHIPSGRALNVYFRLIKDVLKGFDLNCSDDIIWDKITHFAYASDSTQIKTDLGFFENSVNSSIKGSICNIGEYDLTIGNLFRSALEQMADNFCEVADRIISREDNYKILFSGGIANRFELVRNRICEYYSDYSVQNSDGDTLEGLNKYYEIMNK